MKRLRQEKGMVLLLVLVVVTLLASLLTEFAFSTLVDLRLTETFRDSTRAWYLARGGITVGRTILQQDKNGYDAPGDPEELWAQGVANYPVGEGAVSISIEDLGGRLSVNALLDGSNVDPTQKARFHRLFDVLGIADGEALTGALIDWIDHDDTPYVDPASGASGAEDAYYRDLPRPYRCKNAPLDALEELGLVRGFTPEVVGIVTPHLTTYGATTVNANSASTEVLMALSEDPVIDRRAAEAIIASREAEPFKTAGDLQRLNQVPGLENLLRTYIGVTGKTYRILATAQVNDGARQVEAIVEKAGDKLLYLKVN